MRPLKTYSLAGSWSIRVTNDLSLLVRHLEAHAPLSPEDRDAIMSLPAARQTIATSSYLVREGEPAKTCALLVDGIVYRQKITGAGVRQIVSFHLRGEALDFQNVFLGCADHDVRALTPVVLMIIPREQLLLMIRKRPAIAHAVLMSVLIEASIFREWIVNVGRRGGEARVAHLLCEYAWRMDVLDPGKAEYEFPFTQEQIGDATGLTAVHVNRMLGLLEEKGFIRRERRLLRFLDIHGLRRTGDFDPAYLHGNAVLDGIL